MDLPLRRGTVVADDVEDQRVVEDAELLERVDETANVVVCVLEEAGEDLHLASEDRLQLDSHLVPRGDLSRASGELGVGRDHAQFLLSSERLLADLIPALIELP